VQKQEARRPAQENICQGNALIDVCTKNGAVLVERAKYERNGLELPLDYHLERDTDLLILGV
jgi:hypothetical protein